MTLYLKINFSILTLLICQMSFGQDFVYGTLLDENELPIYDAVVYWDVKDQRKRNKTFTEIDGRFKIPKIDGDDATMLIIEFAGKETEERTLKAAKDANYDFGEITMKIKGITSVTASRWEQSIYEVPASTVIITREEIEQNGYITLQEILENVPGLFTIDHRYSSGVTIGIRGFWTDFSRNVMIQLNGVNMLNERRNDFPLDKINVAVESIDKIEIVRGPMSVIYGAGAFFGVINIITNDSQEKAQNAASLNYGSQQTLKGTCRYAFNENGINLSFNAMWFQRDGFAENWRDMIDSEYATIDSGETTVGAIGFENAITAHDYYVNNSAINPERYSRKQGALNFAFDYDGFFFKLNYANSNTGFSFKKPGPGERNDYKTSTANYQVGYIGKLRGFGNGLDWQFKYDYMHSRGDQISNLFVDSIYVLGEDRVSSYRSELNARYTIFPLKDIDTSGFHKKSDRGKKWYKFTHSNHIKLELLGGFYFNNNFENGSFYNAPEQYKFNWYVGLDDGAKVHTYAGYLQSELKLDSLGARKKGALQIFAGLRGTRESSYKMLHTYNQDFNNNLDLNDLGFAGQDSPTPLTDTEYYATKSANPTSWLPRVAAVFHHSGKSDNYFKAMFGTGVNEINVVRNTFDRMWPALLEKESKDSIKYLNPEKIYTYELGHTLVNDNRGFEINTNLFLNMMDGLITRETNSANTSASSTNDTSRLVTRGVEFIGRYTLNIKDNVSTKMSEFSSDSTVATVSRTSYSKQNKVFIFNGGLTLQSTTRIAEADIGQLTNYFSDVTAHKDLSKDPTSFSPQILLNLNIGYMQTFKVGRFSARIGTNYVGKMASQKENSAFIDREITDSYWRPYTNIRLSDINFKRTKIDKNNGKEKENGLKKGGLYVNLKVSNIFDKQYHYPSSDATVWATHNGVLGRGRQMIGTIGFKF